MQLTIYLVSWSPARAIYVIFKQLACVTVVLYEDHQYKRIYTEQDGVGDSQGMIHKNNGNRVTTTRTFDGARRSPAAAQRVERLTVSREDWCSNPLAAVSKLKKCRSLHVAAVT